MFTTTRIIMIALVAAVATGSVIAQDCPSKVSLTTKKDIVDTAVAAGDFTTLATALTKADLVGALKGKGPFTVFAPTDAAFAKLPKKTLTSLLLPQNRDKLVSILTFHVVPGSLKAGDVLTAGGLVTLNGQRADISTNDHGAMIDGARIVKTNIECTNGVIHVIDSVIMPSNMNIVATAKSAKKFNILLAAAKAAGLVDALSGKGPLTVFAPTDDAFAKIDGDTLKSLLRPENRDKLASILKYHVVAGRVYSNAALKAGRATTLQGGSVHITAKDGVARVEGARLVKTDIDASNGVIHVIDSVLIPTEKTSVRTNGGSCPTTGSCGATNDN